MFRNSNENKIIVRLSLIREVFTTKSIYLAATNQIIFLKGLKNLADFTKLYTQAVFMVICNEQCIKFIILQVYETLYLHFDTLLSK